MDTQFARGYHDAIGTEDIFPTLALDRRTHPGAIKMPLVKHSASGITTRLPSPSAGKS